MRIYLEGMTFKTVAIMENYVSDDLLKIMARKCLPKDTTGFDLIVHDDIIKRGYY